MTDSQIKWLITSTCISACVITGFICLPTACGDNSKTVNNSINISNDTLYRKIEMLEFQLKSQENIIENQNQIIQLKEEIINTLQKQIEVSANP